MSRFFRLRKATADDIFFIRSLELDPANIFVHSWDEETHHQKMADPRVHYLVAEDIEGTSLGFSILIETEPGTVEWRRVVVARRGDGIGTEFMQTIIDDFRDKGTAKLWLDVYQENTRAYHVYSSLGFTKVRVEPLPDQPDKDLVIMELPLGSINAT